VRAIADALGVHATRGPEATLRRNRPRGCRQVAGLGARGVRNLLPQSSKPESDLAALDFEHVHRKLARPLVTLLLLWNEYVAKCRVTGELPYEYSTNSTAGG
jgi:hypothetical protein